MSPPSLSRTLPVATPTRGWILATVAASGAGLALGVLTNLAQGWLPGEWNQIANSGAVWSVVAFVAGALPAGRVSLPAAAVAGLCAESGLVVGYYGYAEFGRDGMGSLLAPLVWLAMAVISGPIFGIAGAWWRNGRTGMRRVLGLAAVAGLFGSEGLHYAWTLHYGAQAWTCLAIFLVVPLLARSHAERVLTLLAAISLSLIAYGAIYVGLLGTVLG